MNGDIPSIELVIESQDEVSYTDVISHSTSFIIDENSCHESFKEENYNLVNTIEEFEELLRQHEVEQYTKYTIIKTNGIFKGCGKDPASKPRVHWGILSKVSPELATTPYLIVGTRYYVCHLGKCYYANKLRKFSVEEHENKKRYKKVTDSKKVGCPASFKVQRLILFPENKLLFDTRSDRARMGEFIRENITSVKIDHKYIFKFPDSCDHQNHKEQHLAAEKEPMDKKVVNKIKEVVQEGITNVDTISEMLSEFVETNIKICDKNRRRFYPAKIDIQRTIYKAKLSFRKCKNDQNKLKVLKGTLGDSDEVYFRPSSENQTLNEGKLCADVPISRKCGLIFVYQNKEMKRLYNLYGHHCILLDPTYKFCRFSFPLYFIVVQTNVGYQIVGLFLTELETKDSIIEALTVIYQWNPSVIPRYAMTDNNIDEIKALESLYPDIKVFISHFYCELAWEQRLQRKDFTGNREEAIEKLRSIANAVSEDKVQKSINELKCWHSNLLKEYFEKYWQKELKKWTICYRPTDLLFENNDAIDRLYDEFSYISLSKKKNCTLSEMVLYLCQQFIPETLQKYKTLNFSILHKHLVSKCYIPTYLTQAPQWLLDFITKETMSANKSLPYSYVEGLREGHFSLLSKTTNEKFFINFSPEQKQVSCTCFSYLKRRIICEHAIVVGKFYPLWNLEKICSWLFENSIYKFDKFYESSILNESQVEHGDKITPIRDSDTLCKKDFQTCKNESPDICSVSLKEKCKRNLQYLGTLVDTLNNNELEEFQKNLKEFCSSWSLKNGEKIALNSAKEYENDLPYPMLRKIKDFYNKVGHKSGLTLRKRRGRKRKKLKMDKRKVEEIPFKYEENEIEMSSITTFYDNGFDNNSLNSVNNLETKTIIKSEQNDVDVEIRIDSMDFD